MGTTLQHGIFLPAEGERNCYDGLASNWTILDGVVGGYSSHAANLTIHVTAEDKSKWDAVTNKADSSALTAHTGDTTIHVTAADKTKWDAVTGKADASALTTHTGDNTIHVTAADKTNWNGKADDTGVMHLTGDEASTGKKTFGDMATFKGSYLGTEVSTNARTVMVLESNRDTSGQSGLYITKFRQNKAQGSMTGNDVVYIAFDVLENSVRTDRALGASFTQFVNDKPTKVIFYSDVSGDRCLGADTNKWTEINGLNPGALSMPNLSAGVDISGYITAGKSHNEYTPSVDGWVSVILKSTSGALAVFIYQGDMANGYYGATTLPNDTEPVAMSCLPVKAGTVVNIDTKGSNSRVYAAKFYPCAGNV